MAEDNAGVVRSLMDSINSRDVERGAALTAEGAEFVDVPTGETFVGPQGWRDNYNRWLGAFPDGKVEIVNLITGGDHVAVEYRGRGTNTEAFGDLPATGKSVEMQFCDVLELRDGKVVSGRSYYDLASLLRQLGVMPEPAAASAG